MKYRLLGNSGLRVSEAALGTATFGEEWGWGSVKDEARKVYDAFREAGGNFIDSANSYTKGTSESFLGEFMKDHRQSMVLATKYSTAARGTDPNASGNHRKNMMQAVEASLRRLQTDYIDLYWVHIWDQITPVEEVMKDFMPEQQRTGRIVAAVKAVSDQTGRGMAQVALAWLRYRPVPTIPILGARKLSQLQDNLASFNLALSPEQVKALDEASQIDTGFPYHFYAKEHVRAGAYGGMRDQIMV
jgi:aryl-alcohol dehydrogenase-like predicted oxidoreductase